MNLNEEQYSAALATLNKRASRSKMTTILFIYALLISLVSISTSLFYIKIKSNDREDLLSSLTRAATETHSTLTAITGLNNATRELIQSLDNFKSSSNIGNILNSQLTTAPVTKQENTLTKILEIAGPILLILSSLLFIVYILRLFIVFIKYNMQMSNDYDNQKISLLLSGGNTEEFSKILNNLRSHNITFEKTPYLPQEKIILKLIDLARVSRDKI
ncbi:hypothetical protein MXF07_17080 [Klebsiella pneumoniae]|uniref:hypothetical protein n=1 Tax=Klebsiella pneumoniae complex TaxID=3390273 RepID=UPI0008E6C556|nr:MULTISPECIES: hypothetical protein [Klebsiella]MDE8406218.1 hypothetical protein [Klebsiella pneumoniae]MEB5711069.1 hypothetical protein [Klebsiella pneumoniae]MEB5824660.1 hypothetical protein [Klebsiella pneumoniae]SFH39352.1 hypothetical protein SAMN03159418_03909 [Klebsiella quasipneumoniae]SFY04636.1 hypothetical protein SAMN03159364_03919 [Klebsiella quasipneumoniae]